MLFRQLTSSLRMGLRMLRTAVTRPFRAIWFRLRRATNLGRQFSKVVPAVTKSVTKVKLKPETRADYIDAGPVFIAKSLFVVIALVLIVGGLFVYYIGWPFVQSRFLTACLPVSDTRVETYTGRVKLYADDGKTVLLFHGKLEEGAKTGRGKEYYESGQLQYEGMFASGLYEGKGTLYDEQNHRLYEGDFAAGSVRGMGLSMKTACRCMKGIWSRASIRELAGSFMKTGKPCIMRATSIREATAEPARFIIRMDKSSMKAGLSPGSMRARVRSLQTAQRSLPEPFPEDCFPVPAPSFTRMEPSNTREILNRAYTAVPARCFGRMARFSTRAVSCWESMTARGANILRTARPAIQAGM